MKKGIKILTVFGTRPEVIKLAPFIKALEGDTDFQSVTCATTQHKELQNDVLALFDIKADHDLDIMLKGQDLFHITQSVLSRINPILVQQCPDYVVVQGDTTTAFAAALSAFYHKIPIVHVEAGLRTGNIYSPFPEEVNRAQISRMAALHMAPTKIAVENLEKEGITKNVFHVGNTIVDAVQMVLNMSKEPSEIDALLSAPQVKVLITVHRRENFGEPFKEICSAIRHLSEKYPEALFIWPVHPNPNIKNYVTERMLDLPNVKLCNPVSYEQLLTILNASTIVLSDSGGIQEEACILGKPILVLREETERQELIEAGLGILVGSNRDKIVQNFAIAFTSQTDNQYANSHIYGSPGVSNAIIRLIKDAHNK